MVKAQLPLSLLAKLPRMAVVILAHAPKVNRRLRQSMIESTLLSIAHQSVGDMLKYWDVVLLKKKSEALSYCQGIRASWATFIDAGDQFAEDFFEQLLRPMVAEPHLQMITFDECVLGDPAYPIIKPLMFSPDLERQTGYLSTGFVIRRGLMRRCLTSVKLDPTDLPGVIAFHATNVIQKPRTTSTYPIKHLRTRLRNRLAHSLFREQRVCTAHAIRERALLIRSHAKQVQTLQLAHSDIKRTNKTHVLPKALIIIPTRDQVALLKTCISSIKRKTEGADYQLCVIDNGSMEQEMLRYLKRLSGDEAGTVVVRDDRTFDFAALNNAVAFSSTASQADVLVFLNNDVCITSPNWLRDMVDNAMRPDIGCVGVELSYPDGHVQHSGVSFEGSHLAVNHDSATYPLTKGYISNPMAVTAAAMAIKKSLFERLGGFDGAFAVAYNDVDLCLRSEAVGCRTLCLGHISLIHGESSTRRHLHVTSSSRRRQRLEALALTDRWEKMLNVFRDNRDSLT